MITQVSGSINKSRIYVNIHFQEKFGKTMLSAENNNLLPYFQPLNQKHDIMSSIYLIIFENSLKIIHFLPIRMFSTQCHTHLPSLPRKSSSVRNVIPRMPVRQCRHLHGNLARSEWDQHVWRLGFVSIFHHFAPKFCKIVNEYIYFRMPCCTKDALSIQAKQRAVCN